MTNQRFVSLLLLLPLCVGQMCGTPPTARFTQADGIPAGIYSGSVTLTTTAVVTCTDGSTDQDIRTSTPLVTRQFGEDGRLLKTDGTLLEVGDKQEAQGGPVYMLKTVMSFELDAGRFVLRSAITARNSGFGTTGVEEFTGYMTDVYTAIENGTVRYEAQMTAGGLDEAGCLVNATNDYSGILRR